ncbi:MAG: hypothetical protein ACI845_003526, partial [Gammaproteobacteria bacterium]
GDFLYGVPFTFEAPKVRRTSVERFTIKGGRIKGTKPLCIISMGDNY